MTDHYDVIVIGSGAGGGTLTHALAPTGKRVLLLERGGFMPREIENWDSKAVWLDKRYTNAGKWTDAATGKTFTPKQHYYVGGNTKVYGAILFRFREQDFDAIQHVDGISPAWPIGYADLQPWYTRAERLYQVHGERGTDPTEPPSDAAYPFPAISHEPRIAQLSADLRNAGLTPFPLPNGILLDEEAPWRSACIRCATCDGYACPTNGKADAAVIAVDPALRYPNVTLLTGALVTRLATDGSGRTVTGVVVERDGAVERYSADVVVVAGGAINSAALLLRSASEQHPDGLGNGSGQLGRNLMLHNNSSLIAFSKTPNPTKFQKTLGINDFYHADPDSDFPFPLGAMQMLGKSDATLIAFDVKDHPDPAEVARHALDFWLTTEDLPLPDNRVTVDAEGAISLRYTPTNLEAHRRLRAKFEGLLSAMQCRDEVYENLSYVGGRLGIAGVAHQNGTARFGTDPATSVLDLDCKLHEVDNVYVADSSFFVSSTAVNPTLTIIANALRVAENVATRASGFTSYDPAFEAVTGRDPVLAKVLDTEAHEGPVYVADEDALYFTTLPRVRREAGLDVPLVDIRRLALDGQRFPLEPGRVSMVRPQANAANGMTLAPDGSLLVCEQGSWYQPARVSRVDPRTGTAVGLVDRIAGNRLSSPNDVVVRSDGTIWFTDPSYGFLQGFRPQPESPDAVYRLDPATGSLTVADASCDKPNGLAFSPDGSVLYVTDSGANHEPGSFEPSRPHQVVALNVDTAGAVRGRRVLADISPGFPDGITTDEQGRVYVSSFSGVQVFTPDGHLLGQIDLPGAVNFTFGGATGDVLFITADTAIWAAMLNTRGA